MSTNIRFKRSDIPGKVPSLDSIDLGELAINTADGKLFTKQEIKQPDGFAAIQKIIEIGAQEVPNVLYVAKNGDDSNSGRTLGQAFLTLKKALSIATPGTTIFLKSGEYIEDNPLRVPARVSVVGDNLRNTTVRPKNPTKDIFWVYNGAYIFCMNFKGHIAPSAAVCFPPDGSAGEIVTSPYTQAVTSITTTGTGMRVDGALTTGLRSMVCDAFTQYNQGGIGIHMLNRGNTQLVSIFTICCDISFMCENGGFCSVNLSNSSFGNYGLVSRGASDPLYRGVVKKSAGRQITFKNLARRPNIGDGVLFADYNQRTCDRDNGLVVDSLAFDLLYEGTTQSTFAGLRYWAKDDITTGIQQQAQTAAAIKRAQIVARSVVDSVAFTSPNNNASQVLAGALGISAGSSTAKRIVTEEFDIISRIVTDGPKSPALIIGPDLDAAEPEYKILREQVLDRKAQIADQAIDFLKKNYSSLAFVTAKCKRDITLIIEAVADDMIFGTNYKTIKAAITYLTAVANVYNVVEEQRVPTIEAYKFVRDKIVPIVQEDATLLARVQSNFEIITKALDTDGVNGGKTYISNLIDPSNGAYALTFPAQQDTDADVVTLIANLQANKLFVVEEVIDYINKNWPTVVAYNYSQDTCRRDIGYAIDAISYDLIYGGNSQTLDAAKRYFDYASGLNELRSSEEVPATIDAFGRAQLLSQRVVILDPIESTQVEATQEISGLTATTQTQVNRLGGLFSVLLKQLETSIVGTSDFIQPNGKRLDDTGLDNAYALLQANKQFIKNDVINYLSRAYPGFDYDRVKCARDVGYIIDSVCFDLVHGGNRQAVTAGIYYFDFNEESNVLKSVVPNQIKQTVNAYKYMKELLRDVLTCSPVPNPWQPAVPQITDLPAATGSEVVAVGNLIDIINEILVEGPNNSEDSIQRLKQPIGLTASSDANKIRAFNLLMANREFIRAEMIAYINQNWYTISEGDTKFARVNTATDLTLGTTTTGYPTVTYQPTVYKAIRDAVLAAKEDIKTETIKFMANSFFDNFSFNKPKCYRDVGLILDAILSDMIFGSNYKTITAAVSYLRAYASEVVGAQKVQTVASLKAAKDITLRRIVAPSAKEEISTRFDIVIDILDGARVNDLGQTITNAKINNVSYSPTSGYQTALSYPIPVRNNEQDIDRYTAVNILRDNIDFIKDEIVAYIDANFTLNQFDREKCARDVGLIVDAIGYDLMFISNFRSISAGRSYLRANTAKVTGSQKLATMGSFKYLKKLVTEIVKGNNLAVNSVQRSMDIILEILDKGEVATPKYIIPFPAKGREIEYKRARDLVEKNREFIIDDVITYVNTPGLELIPGEVEFEFVQTVGTGATAYKLFKTDGSFTVSYSQTENVLELQAGDLIRISGKTFGTSTIDGYSSPATYKVATLSNSTVGGQTATTGFKLVNLDGSAIITYGGTSGKTTTMRFEKVSAAQYADPAGFDVAKCRRDLELILDAIFYDTTYGGTLESEVAGKSYVAGTLSQLNPLGSQSDEVTATLRAYRYLKTIVSTVAQDIVWVPTVGNTTIQTRSPNGSDGSATAAKEMETCVNLILKLIDDVNDEDLDDPLYTITSKPSLSWVDPALIKAHNALQTAKENTKDAVATYVDENYVLFGYDRAKCARDVGYVIDAVRFDMMFNSNVRSIVAGRSYYRAMASVVVKDQKSATLASFQHLKEKLLEIVKPVNPDNPTTAESQAVLRVTRSMDIILNILENGLAVEPTFLLTEPTGGSANADLRDAIALEANRTDIEDDLITYINSQTASGQPFDGVTYNETACRRDVEYILDALIYDLTYGGNLETHVAAQAYYAGSTGVALSLGAGEAALTLDAYEELKTIIGTVTGETTTASDDLIDIIIDYIDDPASFYTDGEFTPPNLQQPDTSWVDNGITLFNDKLIVTSTVNRLKASVTDFVDLNFAYNKDKCARDVGFLIDAMCYDLLYGGNVDTTQAAISYYDGAVTPKTIIPKQIIQTVAAYERLKEVLTEVVQLKDVTPSGNQFDAKARASASMDLVIKILKDGQGFTPKKPFLMSVPTSGANSAADTDWLNATKAISANRQFLIAEVTAYIKAEDPNLEYNQVKCERDVDLIIDAVLYDLTYGGSSATALVAEAYYEGTVDANNGPASLTGELTETIDAYNYLGTLLEIVAAGETVANNARNTYQNAVVQRVGLGDSVGDAAERAKLLVQDILVPTIDGQAGTTADDFGLPSTSWVDAKLVALSDALDDSDFRTAVKAEVNTLLTTKFDIGYAGTQKTQCEEDIDAVIDAVRLDVMFGSNYRSQLAGNAYYRGFSGLSDVLGTGDTVTTGTTVTAGSFVVGKKYKIVSLGSSTNWNTAAGTTGVTYVVGDTFTAAVVGTGDGTVNPVVSGQKDGCIATFELLKDAILEKVALYTTEQVKTGQAGTSDAGDAAADLIQVVLDYIDENPPVEIEALTDWVDADLVELSDKLADSKTGANSVEDVPTAVTNYISDRFEGSLTYDVTDCQEDIRSITDAVRFDMMFDSNFRTITAARAYFRAQASKVVGEQKFATVEAFKFLKEKLSALVNTNATALERVQAKMDLLINIVDKGEKAIPAYVLPSPTGYNTIRDGTVSFGYARNLIETNREFIKAEILKSIRVDPLNATLDFNEAKCSRDIDLILDAVYYDMTYGGNMESLIAGGAYYIGMTGSEINGDQTEAITGDDVAATVRAYTKLQEIIKLVAEGKDVSDLQIIYPQVQGDPGSVAAAQTAKNLAYVIRNLVNQEGAFKVPAPTMAEPNISWVPQDLSLPNDLLVLMKTTDNAGVNYTGRYSVQSQMTEWVRLQQDAAVVGTTSPTGNVADPGFGPLKEFYDAAGNTIPKVGSWLDWFAQTNATAANLVNGQTYVIATPGDVNWTDIGAADSNSGTQFVYDDSNAITGTGTVVKVLLASQMEPGKRYKIKEVNDTSWNTYTVTTISANVGATFIANDDAPPAAAGSEGVVYEMFTYDIAKCERDVALIIDAVRYDMMFGTSFRTATAARSYWRQQANLALASGSTALSNYPQTNQSVELFTFMRTVLLALPARFPSKAFADKGTGEIPALSDSTLASARVGQLMQYIVDVVDAADLDEVNTILPAKPYVLPLPTGGTNNSRDMGFRAARDLIEANRDFIKAEVIDWIDQQKRENREGFQNNPAGDYATDFNFNRKECSEDLDLILDAIYYDLTYGGNMESYVAGLAYYSGVGIESLPADEREATIRAYNYLGLILFDIARSIKVESYQTSLEQVKGTAGSIETARKLGELVDIVINVVKGGTKQLPPRQDPDFLAGDETLAYVRISVQEQKAELQARIADYIDSFILQYNTEKCARDVGLILDAAMYDLVLNSNFQSVTAGSVYLQKAANVVYSTQIGPQLQAIKFIRDKVIEVSQTPPLVKNEAAIGRITNLFDVMFDIIDKGVEVAPPIVNVPPIGAAFNPNAVNAANSLLANKEFLKEEVVAYVTANYKTYDQSRCSRDVGLIIDAALYDLLLGTNYNSVKAGLAYRRATSSLVLTDQLQETLGGIDFAKQKVVELLDDANAIASVTRSFELISSIIGGGSVPTARVPLPGGSVYALSRPTGSNYRDPAFKLAADALLAAKATLQTAVTDWIGSQKDAATDAGDGSIWDGFTYDDQKCEEDVGFIIDAVAYDLIYGGNMETLNAGFAYYAGTDNLSLNAGEVQPTIEAYTYLADQVRQTVNTALAATADAESAVEAQNLVLLIRNLIDTRANAVAGVRTPSQIWVDSVLQEVNQTFIQEKTRLQDVIIDYVNNIGTITDGAITSPTDYDKDKCRRDVGLVLDAVRYDLMFNTNFRTIVAGRSYRRSFADVITGSQANANISAFKELRERVLGKKLVNVVIDSTSGEFTCDAPVTDIDAPIKVNQPIRVSGVYGTGAGTLANFSNIATQPKTYYVIGTPTTTSFQLSETVGGAAITTTLGTGGSTAGLTFEIRPSLESLDEVITQGLLDTLTADAEDEDTPLVVGREYKIISQAKTTTNAGEFIVGGQYKIVSIGTTDYNNAAGTTGQTYNIGDIFQADTVGIGTGTALYYTNYTDFGATSNDVGTVFVATGTPVAATGGSGQVKTISFRERAERLFDTFLAILQSDDTTLEDLGFDVDMDLVVPAKQGGSGTYYLITPPELDSTDYDVAADYTAALADQTSRIAARNAINSARQDLEDDLIDWIDAQIAANAGAGAGNFSTANGYVEATCRKDIKFILDAIAYDLTFGGNQETVIAGKAYYDGTALGAGELLATIDAYNYLKTLIAAETASGAGQTQALQLVDDLISYIDPKIEDPVLVEADTSWVDSELYVFSDKLKAAGDTVAKATTDYVSANYPGLSYDVATCRRDVKLIIDAVRWDMMFDSNFRTIVAARSYYRAQASTVVGAQKEATQKAFEVVKVALDDIVKSDSVAQARVAALMDIVINLLTAADQTAAIATLPDVSTPYGGTPNASDIGYLNARDRIEENRDFIVAEMRDWLSGETTSFTGYNEDTCIRDVELVLDAVRYDLTYGGNMESVSAGEAYYAGAVLGSSDADHIALTKAAFAHLAVVVEAVAINDDTYAGSITPAQGTANATGSAEAAAKARALVETVRSYVDSATGDQVNYPTVRPSTNWVDNNLALIASTMLDRKESLALQVTDYVTAEFPALAGVYDIVKCGRDVQLLTEAVRWDMMFATNFRSWTAGRAYYRQVLNLLGDALADIDQKDASLAAFRFLKGLLVAIAGNNVTASNRVKSAMNVILDTIEQGPTTRNADDDRVQAAVEAIEAGKDSVVSAIETWLGTQTTSFTGYNADTCLRDVGYVIDAIKYDLTYGGNMETVVAGRSYYSGAVLGNSTADHITLTKSAFEEVASEIRALTGVAASIADRVDTLVANLNALIDSGTVSNEVYADASWSETALQEVAVAFRLQRTAIQAQITDYVEAKFPGLMTDAQKAKCSRDAGLLIDAVRWDMLFNSNFRSITAGRAYYRDAVNLNADALAGQGQKAASIAAFTYLKSILQGIAATNAIADERVTANMDIILEIIENGLGNQADPTITYPAVADAERTKAANILRANIPFLKDEIINFIDTTYSSYEYDEALCARDVEYITYAVAYDMVTGSNYHTVTAARGYLRAYADKVTSEAEQKHITILAFKYLKNLLANYVGGDANAADAVKASMDIIIQAVYEETVANLPAVVVPTAGVTTTADQDSLNAWLTNATNITATKAAGIAATSNSGGTQATCERDIGYVLEALAHDITYGGNWASVIAAKSYRDGTGAAQYGAGEQADTIAAFEGVRDYIIANSGAPAELDTRVTDLIAIINGVVGSDTYSVPAVEYPELLGSNNALEAARNILISNVANAKAKTVRFTNDRAYFVYDVLKCERDIGLILDAVAIDVATGSNYLSIQAGISYLRASATNAIAAPQKWAILAGLQHAKSVLTALVSTNSNAVSAIRAKLSVVIDIINDNVAPSVTLDGSFAVTAENTTGSSYVSKSFPSDVTAFVTGNTITAANRIAAKDALQLAANRKAIIDDIVDNANTSNPATSFNKEKCARDVALILDALSHDLLYGGNYATTFAAKAYFVGTANQLGADPDEITETLTAYQRLKTRIDNYPPFDSGQGGYVAGLETEMDGLVDIIINAITNGAAATEALVATRPVNAIAASALTDAYDTLVDAKDNSSYRILDYINSRPYLVYDAAKCERDVGIILNAVRYDVLYETNFKSIKAGLAYLRSYSKAVTSEQKAATISALFFMKKGITEALAADNTVDAASVTDARSRMDTIIDILDRGTVAVPAIELTPVANAAAVTVIEDNTAFIKAEIRAYIDRNFPELDYDKIKCERDVGFILDALRYDLAFGGNTETREAGKSYWEGTVITLGTHPTNIDDPDTDGGEDEVEATVAAYTYLANLVEDLLVESTYNAYSRLQTVQSKGGYTAGAAAASGTAKTLLDKVVDIVDSANAAAADTAYGTPTDPSETPTGDTDVNDVFDALEGTLPEDVTDEITLAFADQFFVYNKDKCSRDVGFVVEGLAFDALFGGNKESREVASQYAYKGGLVIPLATKGPTVGAFERLVAIIDDIVAGVDVSETAGVTETQQDANPSTLTGVSDLAQITVDVLNGKALPTLVEPVFADVTGFKPDYLVVRAIVRDSIDSIAAQTITFINETYAGFGYLQDTCKRDVGLTLDAVAYDLIYGGNSRTKFAAEQYFSGGRFQIPADSKSATVACFVYLDALARKVIRNDPIVTFQNFVDQDKSNTAATQSEVTNVASLFDAFTDILTNGYISVVQLDATFNGAVDDNTFATFHQVSTITTTGHTLEWVGTGIDVDSALPYNGGVPKPENQLVSEKGGFINFTSTDEKGDFRIGPDLTIKRDSGSIVGRAFNKSLLGVVTPYILALQG